MSLPIRFMDCFSCKTKAIALFSIDFPPMTASEFLEEFVVVVREKASGRTLRFGT